MATRQHVPGEEEAVTVRRATECDMTALLRLAAIDGSNPLRGEVVLVEVGGELWAARSLVDGSVVSDPFRPAAAARELLELHAHHLELAAHGEPRRGRFGLHALLRAVTAQ